jgi:hypothetical protein
MKATGWLDNCPNGLPETNTIPIKPDKDMCGLDWKTAVQSK